MFKDGCNTVQNFTVMGATVFEIAGEFGRPPPIVKGVGTKRQRVKSGFIGEWSLFESDDTLSLKYTKAMFP